MHHHPKGNSRLFGLDLLRSAAISLVLLCHILLLMRFVWKCAGWSVMAGYFGVELFFVLSGFLIGGILIGDVEKRGADGGTLLNFWKRRWLRTLPNYVLFLGINILVAWSVTNRMPQWQNHLWFGQNLTDNRGSFFPEAWSLAVEEWFYLLAPLAVFGVIRLGMSVRSSVLTVAVAGLVGISAWRMFYVAHANPGWMTGTRSVVMLRLDACMFGVLGAFLRHYHPRAWFEAKGAKCIFGVACLITAGWMFRNFRLDESFIARTHLFTLTSLGVALCLPWLESLRCPQGALGKAITGLSKWSYSLYLVNFLIFQWLARETGLGLGEPSTAFIAAMTGLFLSVVASALVYYTFELPILRWRDRGRHSKEKAAAPGGTPEAAPNIATANTDVLPG